MISALRYILLPGLLIWVIWDPELRLRTRADRAVSVRAQRRSSSLKHGPLSNHTFHCIAYPDFNLFSGILTSQQWLADPSRQSHFQSTQKLVAGVWRSYSFQVTAWTASDLICKTICINLLLSPMHPTCHVSITTEMKKFTRNNHNDQSRPETRGWGGPNKLNSKIFKTTTTFYKKHKSLLWLTGFLKATTVWCLICIWINERLGWTPSDWSLGKSQTTLHKLNQTRLKKSHISRCSRIRNLLVHPLYQRLIYSRNICWM